MSISLVFNIDLIDFNKANFFMDNKIIFHLDLDAFFVSVERVLDPTLIGKPVIVGGDPKGRGVVAACSYEARAFGLHSAMPIRHAFKLCPNGIYLHGHFSEYSRFSKAIKYKLEHYAPLLEQASIDEFFLDFSGCERIYGHPYFFASKIQNEIKNELNLPCSIGIAGNKFVAKIASDYAKPLGITMVFLGLEEDFLAPLPIEAMIGVGKKTKTELNGKGFYKISDIQNSSLEYLQIAFGKVGAMLYEHAKGKGNDLLNTEIKRKSIGREHTFDIDTTDLIQIETLVFKLVEDICNTMRQLNWQAKTIGVKFRYSDFETLTRSKSLSEPTSDDNIIYNTAINLFKNNYKRRVSIRLIGVNLSNFSENFTQESLFKTVEDKRKILLTSIDNLRKKYGLNVIHYGIK